MKKNMTVDDLAELMISTMASKEDLQAVSEDVQAVKGDLQAVKVDLQIVKEGLVGLSSRVDDLHIDVQKMDNKINRVENYKVTQLELIKLLREKKVITPTEAHNLLSA